MFEYGYMQNAFWAILIITPLFGLMGTMIVNNKLAFFSDALGHSALTGIAIGALLRSYKSNNFYGYFWNFICFTFK